VLGRRLSAFSYVRTYSYFEPDIWQRRRPSEGAFDRNTCRVPGKSHLLDLMLGQGSRALLARPRHVDQAILSEEDRVVIIRFGTSLPLHFQLSSVSCTHDEGWTVTRK
jgi:hypothetical protein